LVDAFFAHKAALIDESDCVWFVLTRLIFLFRIDSLKNQSLFIFCQ
jgi:hypothetical protein